MLVILRIVQILLIIVTLSCSSNQSMKESVTEVVIYNVGKENWDEFAIESDKINEYLKKEPGFKSRATQMDYNQSGVFLDIVEWENIDAAHNAAKKVQTDEKFRKFISFIDKVESFHHFKKD